ncbi:hypothetical protein JW756_00210 [Candidatus Woesearchaeota archaeon]|nr:hypothetical protein [Candidatus Woesearchaeota archaeon]
MNKSTLEKKFRGDETTKSKQSLAMRIAATLAAGYAAIMLIKGIEPKHQPPHLKQLYNLTRVSRDGCRTYTETSDRDSIADKVVAYYFDHDNNGAPESGYAVFPEGGMALYKFSNQAALRGIIQPVRSEYFEANK